MNEKSVLATHALGKRMGSNPRVSLWSLSSSFAQKQYDSSQKEKNSILWESKVYVKLAVYSIAITSISLFRFPESAYKFGGSLVAAYILLLVLVIQPIVYMELLLGQLYLRSSPVRLEHSVYRNAAHGMRLATAVMVLVFIPNQSIWSLYSNTLVDFRIGKAISTSPLLPWCSCGHLAESNPGDLLGDSNATRSHVQFDSTNRFLVHIGQEKVNCVDQENYVSFMETNIFGQVLNPSDFDAQIAPALYLKKEIHAAREHATDHGHSLNIICPWKLLLSGLVSFGLILFFTSKHRFQTLILKTILWMSVLFPGIIIIILIFQLNQSGRVSTISQLLAFDCKEFKDIRLWVEAVRLAVLTSGVGLGLHTTISSGTRMSYKKYYQISWMFVIFTAMSILVITLLFFSEIEYFVILTGAQSPEIAVSSETPGLSVILLASIFCKLMSAVKIRFLYGVFYIVKLAVLCRIQILAFDTIYRTLNFDQWFGKQNKFSRWFLKLGIIICMQTVLNIPYIIKCTKELFSAANNFYLLSGTWPVIIFLAFQILYFSKGKNISMFEEDLYLTYRLKLAKLFQFQLRSYFLFIFTLLCSALISFDMIQNVYKFANKNSVIDIPEDWPFLYGIAINMLPFIVFFIGLCYGIIETTRNKHKDVRSGEDLSVRKLIGQNRDRDQEEVHNFWNREIRSIAQRQATFDFRSQREDWRATVWPQRLRRPQYDITNAINSIDPHASEEDHYAEEEVLDYSDSIFSISGQSSVQNSVNCLEDLKTKLPLASSSFRDPNPKQKPPRNRVVRQIQHRRPPLPQEWSLGGLGDFSLYKANLNAKPLASDSSPNLIDLMSSWNGLDPGQDTILPKPNAPMALDVDQSSAKQTTLGETNDIVAGSANSDSESEPNESNLPPPPTFLLVECHAAQLEHDKQQQQQLPTLESFASTIPPLPPLPDYPDSNISGSMKTVETEYQENLKAIGDLDKVLIIDDVVVDEPCDYDAQVAVDTTKALSDIIDYLSPRLLPDELSISLSVSAAEEDINYSLESSTLGDGSSACDSFLYDKTVL